MFKISDLDFSVESAVLDAFIDKEDMSLNWGLEIEAAQKIVDDQEWEPQATVEILCKTKPGELKQWSDIAGKEVNWKEAFDEDDEPYGILYVFEHEPIYKSKIKLLQNGNGGIRIDWNAKCDVRWGQKYGTNLDLDINTKLNFKGILFGRKSEPQCKDMLAEFFPVEDFVFTTNENGVSIMKPRIK